MAHYRFYSLKDMLKCLVHKSRVWLVCNCRWPASHVLRYQDLCEDGKSYTRVKFVFS